MRQSTATLVDLLQEHAAAQPEALAYRFLALQNTAGGMEEWTYAHLDQTARSIAAFLQDFAHPGDRAMLLYPSGLEFVAAFLGCLYAGVIAVPAYPPNPERPDRAADRLRRIAMNCEPTIVLTTERLVEGREAIRGAAPEFTPARWITTERIGPAAADRWKPPDISPNSVAFLQYTSGSTGSPKGVINRHGNILSNEACIAHGFESDEAMHVVGWLPLFHDMGLIGNVLHPLYMGASCTLMSPAAFLKRPLNWLSAVSRYRGTVSGGPNFAYDVCTRRIAPEHREALDLSSWCVAYNGSEPVRKETMDRFADAFAPCGFRKESFVPCYGLAEATLYVTSAGRGGYRHRVLSEDALARDRANDPVEGRTGRTMVSAGRAAPSHAVLIADRHTDVECPDGVVGEVWATGPSIAAGYWSDPETTERTFPTRMTPAGRATFLRTGDLGFTAAGELYITGRIKDLIILRGRNLYPHDIEATVATAHPSIRTGAVAAFPLEVGGEERLAILAEVPFRRESNVQEELFDAIRLAVAQEHGAWVHAIVLTSPNRIPKTSSGKIQRHAAREQWQNGDIPVLAVFTGDAEPTAIMDATYLPGPLDPRTPDTIANPTAVRDVVFREIAVLRGAGGSISPNATLTELGLDSLRTLELQTRLELVLGISLNTSDMAELPSLDSLVGQVLLAWEQRDVAGTPRVVAGPREREAPTSSGQRRLFLLEQLAAGTPVYHIQAGVRMLGPLETARLEHAFRHLEQRHAILRTRFRESGGLPYQLIEADLRNEFQIADLYATSPESGGRIDELLKEQAERGFDLEQGPLTRALLLKVAPDEHLLALTQHHIITDGWSMRRLIDDLAGIYAALADNSALPAPPLLEFADFARWELSQAASDEQSRLFWERQVSDLPRLAFPFDFATGAHAFRGGRVRFSIPHATHEHLARMAREENCTLFAALLATFTLLLRHYTGQDDFAVGSVAANRPRELRDVCGFFTNTIAFRCDLSGAPSFRQLLRRTAGMVRETLRHSSFPFAEIARLAGGVREVDENPVFQVNFVYESGMSRGLQANGCNWTPVMWAPDGSIDGTSKFDLSLAMVETADGIAAAFEYNSSRLHEPSVQRLAACFQTLLANAIDAPHHAALRLNPISDQDRRQLAIWNDTVSSVPRDRCFPALFEEQARRTPDRMAVRDARQRLTYAALSRGANAVARGLRAAGVEADSLVVLLIPRGVPFLTAVLGAFKAGAAYVPIDPHYPEKRQEQILRQSGARLVVTTRALAPAVHQMVSNGQALVLTIEDLVQTGGDKNLTVSVSPLNLAYVIYTSGSTGTPKGAMVEHAGMLNHLYAKINDLALTQADIVAQTASQCFDISVWQFLAALLVGGAVEVIDTEITSQPVPLFQEVARTGITILEVVPSLLRAALEELDRSEIDAFDTAALRWIMLTGEALPADLARRWLDRHHLPVVNAYGPTECSDDVAHCVIRDSSQLSGSHTPIGRPIINTQLYVLSDEGVRTPIGVVGELHVGGIGVGRGYWHDPARTAEAFVPDPFSKQCGARLYRTGDRVRMLPNGELVFLGRDDGQVKVRGFRIELGDVEAALEENPDVAAAAVTAFRRQSGDASLVAYVQPRNPTSASALRAEVRDHLPEYMVPSTFVLLDQMPLTANGKIDRLALPDPAQALGDAEPSLAAPLGPAEEMVAAIWAEVLGAQRVGAEDNFFEVGGHSLLAAQVVARVRSSLGVEVPLRAVFEAPTVSALARHIERARGRGEVPPVPPRRRAGSGELPLSFAQQRLWFLEQLTPGEATYNVPGALRIDGPLEIEALHHALGEIVQRHEALRTTFVVTAGEARQRVLPALDLPLPVVAVDSEAAARQWLQAEAGRPFDLEHGPLIRAAVLRLGPDAHVLSVNMHHIISDGWSLGVLMREASELYGAYLAGRQPALLELEIQYADYSLWQREWLQGEVLEAQVAYWRQELAGAPTALDLPVDHPRTMQQSHRGGQHPVRLAAALAQPLRQLGRQHGATLYMVLLAGFQVLLARYTGQQQVLVGSPIAGRTRRETEGLIGFFVNTLVLRGNLAGDPSFAEMLERVKDTTLNAFAHQDVPFEKLVEVLSPQRDLSRSPLFQVMFILQNAPMGRLELGPARLVPLAADNGTAKFEITLSLEEQADGGIEGYWEYNGDLFEPATIERMADHYIRLLEAALADPRRPVALLDFLAPQERRQLLIDWNDTRAPYPDACLHELFELQAARTPDAPALLFGDAAISYRELNAQANRIAHYLLARHGSAPRPVGVCMVRLPGSIAAILGILKTGGPYVPLDPAYPPERLRYMAQRAKLATILTDAGPPARLEGVSEWIEAGGPTIRQQPSGNPACRGKPDNPAYIVFTSGSTGAPNGVVGLHRGAVNRCNWMWRRFPFVEDERSAMKTSTNFVDSVWEIFGPLLQGVPSVIFSQELVQDAERFISALAASKVTRIVLVPSLLRAMLQADPRLGERLPRLRYWTLSGEALGADLVRTFRQRLPGRILLNLYGSSEASGDSTSMAEVDEERSGAIGRPIDNTQAYVLDGELQPTPIGLPGEIYLGGDGLAGGYLVRPDLTAERFLPNPFSARAGACLFRTMDRGCYRPDGVIEYLGRADRQIKIRGMRVDLAEIEVMLQDYPRVRQAAVVHSAERLIAYVVLDAEFARTAGVRLRAFLRDHLPEYMVPSTFVLLDQMPLTANGKIDRLALPDPAQALGDAEPSLAAPLGPAEEMVAAIWAEVLGAQRVGAEDNFFEVGGHSLLAAQVVARVRSSLGVEVPLRAVFEAPTVSALARHIERARGRGEVPPVPPRRRAGSGELPLSFAQQRLWFLEQLTPGEATYNVPGALRIDGPLEIEALHHALGEIVQRHEALRTTFVVTAGEARQRVLPALDLPLPVVAVDSEAAARQWLQAEAGRPFDLEHGPLIRAAVLRLGPDAHVLSVNMHHIISDGWSLGVLMREASELYGAYLAGRQPALLELEIQYADYSLWQREWLQGEVLEAQVAYWRQELAGAPTALDLPVDHPRTMQQSHRGGQHPVRLAAALAQPLRQLGRQHGATLYMVLLAGFQVLLARYTGQQQVLVGSPIAGRTRRETEGLIGFFVNTLVLRGNLAGDPSFAEMLERVKDTTLNAFAHQDVPFEKLVEVLSPQRDLSRSPLFQVMFILQNAPMGRLELGPARLVPLAADNGTAKFEITLSLEEQADGGIEGYWEYNGDLFEPATIERMADHYIRLLEAALADPRRPVALLDFLAPQERRQLLIDWNDTRAPYPDACLHELFELQAARTPDAPALLFGDAAISYRELNRDTNRLASTLRRNGVRSGDRVGVLIERSANLIKALLAILKAGAAYVPLDADYPDARIAFMLKDSDTALVLASPHLQSRLPAGTLALSIDAALASASGEVDNQLSSAVAPDALCYILHTSGSTGRPKGVMVSHRGLANCVACMQERYCLGADDRFLFKTSLNFDPSVWEIFWPLMSGGAVVIAPPDAQADPVRLVDLISRYAVTSIYFVPSMLNAFLNAGDLSRASGLRRVICGGETLPKGTIDRFVKHFRSELHHSYGPTETSIASAEWTCDPTYPYVPIGRPLGNVRLYVLDRRGQPVPRGVAGELHIGGTGLAMGYAGLPDLTAEHFVPDPFSAGAGERLYRTGDLVYHLPDGNLRFLGRLDDQVKIRGYRIELGEVERVLELDSTVAEAVATVRTNASGVRSLAAYVVLRGTVSLQSVRETARTYLPPYMVPSAYMVLDAVPRGLNGKSDRRALPTRDRPDRPIYVPPATDTERQMATIWAELLSVGQVGREDDFFELGGHSLLATRMLARVNEHFGSGLQVRQVFELPSISQLSHVVDGVRPAPMPPPILRAVRRPVRVGTSVPPAGLDRRLRDAD